MYVEHFHLENLINGFRILEKNQILADIRNVRFNSV